MVLYSRNCKIMVFQPFDAGEQLIFFFFFLSKHSSLHLLLGQEMNIVVNAIVAGGHLS